MKIALTFNLRKSYELDASEPPDRYVEFDSEETIEAIKTTLESLGHDVVLIGDIKSLLHFLPTFELDMVFNIAEGMEGRSREAQIPAILEAFHVPYTFSDPLTLALSLHKGMTKAIIKSEGIPTPDSYLVEEIAEVNGNLPFPLFIKPAYEGTAKGIDSRCLVKDFDSLHREASRLLSLYRQPVLVERYLPGKEYTVGILGTGRNARVLGMMQVVVRDKNQRNIYTRIAKEECENRVTYVPGEMTRVEIRQQIETISLKAYQTLGCRDAGRVDIRCDEFGNPCFLEINPLAGLHPTHSDLCIIASQVGMSYTELIEAILASAVDRYSSRGTVHCAPTQSR
ncbi:MAG: ATP-grasp domain-containing protein [Thermodesulfobacteriota bacterium]